MRNGPQAGDTTIDQLGSARQVIIKKEDTTIVDGKGSQDAIKARINQSGYRSMRLTRLRSGAPGAPCEAGRRCGSC